MHECSSSGAIMAQGFNEVTDRGITDILPETRGLRGKSVDHPNEDS